MSAILTTHRHADHWQALAEIVDRRRRRGLRRRRRTPTSCRSPSTSACTHGDTITVGDADARDHRAARAHAGLGRRALPRPGRHRRTCSPATRCSRAASARPGRRRTSVSLIDDVERARVRRAARRHLVLSRPRRRLDARRRAPAPGGVARARLVVPRRTGRPVAMSCPRTYPVTVEARSTVAAHAAARTAPVGPARSRRSSNRARSPTSELM